MKKLLLYILIVFSTSIISYSQDTWSSEQMAVLEKFGLEKNDHRGIILIFQEGIECENKVSTVHEALEMFLTSQSKKDLSTFCIANDPLFIQYNGQALDLYKIVSLYIQKKD